MLVWLVGFLHDSSDAGTVSCLQAAAVDGMYAMHLV